MNGSAKTASVPVPGPRKASRAAWVAFAAAALAIVAANFNALAAWVELWLFGGHTFGVVAFLAAAWLVWRTRAEFRDVEPAPDWRASFVVIPLGIGLALARLVDLQLAQLAILVAALAASAWALLGAKALRLVLEPLSLMCVALPFWEYLRPVLQDMTVRATVLALQAVGTPVFVDETYIHTPNRTVLILSECSGLQYFQAGVTIGVIYAWLSLRSAGLRLAVVAAFAAMSVLGNWIRVDLLITLPPLSETAHVGVGWVVFVAMLAPLFALTRRLERIDERRQGDRGAAGDAPHARAALAGRATQVGLAGSAAAVFVFVVTVPALASRAVATAEPGADGLAPVLVQAPWLGPYEPVSGWNPVFRGADEEQLVAYRFETSEVELYRAYYALQRQGSEAVNQLNSAYDPSAWVPRGGATKASYERFDLGSGRGVTIAETRLRNVYSGSERLVWQWYEIAGRTVARPWRAKVTQMMALLTGRSDANVVALSIEGGDVERARQMLRTFIRNSDLLSRETPAAGAAADASVRDE